MSYAGAASPARRLAAWARRSPWLPTSLAAHAALGAALYAAGPWRTEHQAAVNNERRIAESHTAAARRNEAKPLQHQVQRLEEAHRRMVGNALGGDDSEALAGDPKALLQRAETLAEAIRRTEQRARADELARLLKLTPEEALAKLETDTPARAASSPPPAAQTPASAVEALAAEAQQALARAEQRSRQAEQGHAVRSAAATGAPTDTAGLGGSGGHGAGGKSPRGGGMGEGGEGIAGVGGRGGSGNAALAGTLDEGSVFQGELRRYGELRPAPALDTTTLRLGAGRSLGAGGQAANRVYLDKWYVAGPFEGDEGPASLRRAYPPELGVDLDAAYAGKGGRTLQWRYVDNARYPLVPDTRSQGAVYYAYTELRSDVPRTLWLDIGADDDSRLWLNDELVWTSDDSDKPWYHTPFYNLRGELSQFNLTEGSRRVQLQPGRNRLLFKLYNGIDLMFFSVVLRP